MPVMAVMEQVVRLVVMVKMGFLVR